MDDRGAARLSDLQALGALAEPTRRRLYEWVVAEGVPVSREEAARAAGIDRSLAAYHLERLVEHGLLEASYARPPGRGGPGAGRPAKRYQRARHEFALRTPPRDYRLLAELLVEVADQESEDARTAIAQSARDLGRRLGETASRDGVSRAETLWALLRSRGYEPAEVEPGVVRLRNCPFAAVAARFPAFVCGLNVALVDGMIAGLRAEPASALFAPEDGVCCVAIATGAIASLHIR